MLDTRGAGLTVDHDFGPATAAAVTNYQTSVGLPATGIVDPATKAALYGQSAPTSPPDLGSGRYAAIVSEAQAALNDKIPYVWGGGHRVGSAVPHSNWLRKPFDRPVRRPTDSRVSPRARR